jgi:hypothetical protein
MDSFSKSARSNAPLRLLLLPFSIGLAAFAVYRIANGDGEDFLASLIAVLFFVLCAAIVFKDFLCPHVMSFHADKSGFTISHSRRGAIFALPWSGVHKLELDTHNGLHLYAEGQAGVRHKLNEWVSFTEEEAMALFQFVSVAAPQVEIVAPRKIGPNQPPKTTRAFGPRG